MKSFTITMQKWSRPQTSLVPSSNFLGEWARAAWAQDYPAPPAPAPWSRKPRPSLTPAGRHDDFDV